MARTFLDEVRLTAVPSAAGNYLTLSSNGTISQRTQSQVKSALGVTALEGRTISAGTGLSGGGNLGSNVSLSVSFGTAAGTVAEGNAVVRLSGNQTVAGVKTFSSIPVLPATNPTTDNQAARKAYVDSQVSSVNTGVMSVTSGAGISVTGTTTPTIAVDTTVLRTTGNQTVGGTKTFSSIPVLPSSNPTTANQAARKGYVDTQITGHNHSLSSLTGVSISSPVTGQLFTYNGSNWTNSAVIDGGGA